MQKKIIRNIYDIISKGVDMGIGRLYTEDDFYESNIITVNSRRHINFGSYSYLGLELDERLKEGAIDAIRRYGTQYPSSRTYVSSTPYRELESLLATIFQCPVIMATTTTLAHVAVMPVVIEEDDIILMDQQVHSSVQFMVHHLKLKGVPFEIVRHNDLIVLEKKILEHSPHYRRIWYMVDGVYSMYGDTAPMKELEKLMNKHRKFHVYADDAHGMSWAGDQGAGYVLSQIRLHEKMVLVTSLNKAFAAGGAVVLIPDESVRDLARTCGGPFIFAGQHQMSALGAGIACAKIHLSDEINDLQKDLIGKIRFCHEQLLHHNLPVISDGETPIFFVGVGLPRVGYNLVKKMLDSGQYVNLAIFPAVSETCTGVRFTITCLHSCEQIETMVKCLSTHFQEALKEEGRTLKDIHTAFRKVKRLGTNSDHDMPQDKKYTVETFTSITKMDKDLWNTLLGSTSTFDWDGLAGLENIFTENDDPTMDWEFLYYMMKDGKGEVVFATYCTCSLGKDDVIAPPEVSYEVEIERLRDGHYLCSKTLMMGCPFSIGKHFYLNEERKDWKEVFMFFIDHIWQEQERLNANIINLRDLQESDSKLKEFLTDQGFIKLDMLENYSIRHKQAFTDMEEFLSGLNSRHRRYVKQNVLPHYDYFNTQIVTHDDAATIDILYQLYENVRSRSYELNLFPYPKKLIQHAIRDPKWEVMVLKVSDKIVAMSVNYCSISSYEFLLAGLDYAYVEACNIYPQLLYRVVERANEKGHLKIGMGVTTGQNKRKFGATSKSQEIFIQMKDNLNASILTSLGQSKLMKKQVKDSRSIKEAEALKRYLDNLNINQGV